MTAAGLKLDYDVCLQKRQIIRGVLNIYLPNATNMIGTERFQRHLHSHFESVNGDLHRNSTQDLADRAEHAGK